MSVSDKKISTVGGSGRGGGRVSGSGGDDGDEDDGESGGVQERDEQRTKQRATGYSCNGFSKNFGKARHLVLLPFTRAQKKLSRKSHLKASSSLSGSVSAPIVSSSSGKRIDGCDRSCCFCFTRSRTGESHLRSQTSDPNDPTFTYDMLRVFIERNDFYSKECNPHLDFEVSCCRD